MREITAEKVRKAYKCSPHCEGWDEMVAIISELDYEIEQLEKAYSHACDAAGSMQQRASEAEQFARDMNNQRW